MVECQRYLEHDSVWLAAWQKATDCRCNNAEADPAVEGTHKTPGLHVTKGKTSDNAANLAPTFLSAIVSRYQDTRLGRQELDGDILDDCPGALFSRDLIEACRIPKGTEPAMRRIVVAIDPAVSVSETSDATGIVVCGVADNGHGYVLQDLSGKYSPTQWARIAIGAYRHHKADRIVAKANQGGAMVETTLRAVDNNVPVRLVHASRGKVTRAEPISALFEQHRAHMVGSFPQLEDEMCSFEPGTRDSPDVSDAMVHGFTDLCIEHNYEHSVIPLRM